jgi:hypothetical protein
MATDHFLGRAGSLARLGKRLGFGKGDKMSTKVSAEELRTMFHLAVEDLKNPPRQRNGLVELPGSDIGYPVDKICAALLNTDAAWDMPQVGFRQR